MRILIVKLSSLGDILHVLPCVHALKSETHAEVDWIAHPEFAPLVQTFSDVNSVLTFPRHNFLRSCIPAIRALRKTHYDLAIDLHGLLKSAFVTSLARASRKIGPSYAREGSAFFYPERAGLIHRDCHAAVQAFDTLDYLGIPRPTSPISAQNFRLPPFSPPAGSPLIAIAPVSRWDSKNWPVKHFSSFVSLLSSSIPSATIALIGGKSDLPTASEICTHAPANRIVNLCGKTSISESLALLSHCDLLVSNDSGPVHMAAAVGTPCLVLFGPTRPDWTGPFGNGHRLLMKSLSCQPCLKHLCPLSSKACLSEISPNEVLSATLEMLQISPPRKGAR